MAPQPFSQTTIRFAQLATSGLLVLQAAIATTAISALVATNAVSAQETIVSNSSVQLSKTNGISLKAVDLTPSQAASCWTNPATQNCSYSINTSHSNRVAQYPSVKPQSNELSAPATVISPQAAVCLTDATQNCSYSISVSESARVNPYPLAQLSALPSFDAPVEHLILVRVSF